MSGYFGALMRASGMSVAGRAPAISRVEPRGIEFDVERSPTATSLPTEPVVSTPRWVPGPAPARDAVEQPARPMPLSADRNGHDLHGELGAESARLRPVTDRTAESPVLPAAQPVDTSKEDPSQAVVRAAMRWVAADPQHVHSASKVVTPPAPASPIGSTEEAGTITGPQARRVSDTDVPGAPTVTSEPMPARDVEAREPSPTQAVASRSARHLPATLRPALATFDHDDHDHVEVSIGAIHVSVEAPAVQTVARPAATPTGNPRPIAAAITTRSTLSRRALRRI